MIKYSLFLLSVLLFFSSLSLKGLNKTEVDSLILVSQSNIADTTKIDIYTQLSQHYIYTEINKTKLYADSVLEISTKIGFNKGVTFAERLLGIYYLFTSDFTLSINHSQLALKLAKQEGLLKIQGSCYNNLGIIYREIKVYDKALEFFYGGLKLATEIHDTVFMIKTVLNIATLHRQMGNAERALEHLFETKEICMQQKDTLLLGNYYYEIGAVYNRMEKNELALEYCQKAQENFKQMNSWYNLSVTMSFFGTIYKELGKTKLAIDYYKKGYDIYQQLGNKYSMVNNLMEVADLYRKIGDYKTSQQYAYKAINLAKELRDSKLKLNFAYSTLRKIGEAQGDYKKAYKYSLLEKELSDSIFDIDRLKQIDNLEILYETEKKEKEIELLKKDTIILDKESNLRKMQRNVAIIGAFVFFILLAMAVNRLKLRRKLFNQKEAKLKAEARYKEEEALRREEELRANAEINKLNNEIIQEELDHRNREITSSALYVAQKNEILGTIGEKLDDLKDFVKAENKKDLNKLKRLIKENIELDDDWNNFKLHFEKVHPQFFETLTNKFPDLTVNEQKICAYLRMNLSGKEIARLMNITPKSTQMSRYRLKKKFNLGADDDLIAFIGNLK